MAAANLPLRHGQRVGEDDANAGPREAASLSLMNLATPDASTGGAP